MLVRIVKMNFKAENTAPFMRLFNQRKNLIAGFKGCHGVKLLRDTTNTNIFFTYSTWINQLALENYRHSDLFRSTWAEVKPMFADKAEAWSVEEVE